MPIGPGLPTIAFNATSLLTVPSQSGVYAICNAQGGYIYFGESNDLQRRLTEHLNDTTHAMHKHGAVSFAFDVVPGELQRVLRQNELILAHNPVCNQMLG